MKEGWICPRCGKINAPFIASCGCKPLVTNNAVDDIDGCDHDWCFVSGGATTEGPFMRMVCSKCGKEERIASL